MSDAQPNPKLIEKLQAMADELAALDAQMADPAVLADHARMRAVAVKRGAIVGIVERFRAYEKAAADLAEMREILAADDDPELVALARADAEGLAAEAASLLDGIAGELVTADDAAVGSVVLELRAGSGGDEAALFAGDLLELYLAYAKARGWTVETLDAAIGDAGGVRSVTLTVAGEAAWQRLGYESGVHCVKRVPATETQGRVHTSTATVAVLPEPEDVQVDLDPADVVTHVTTAQGPGGQNVNKVATAVHLIHRPTGIEVRMQESKSQQQNRQKAMQLLKTRLYDRQRAEADAQRAADRSAMIGTGGRSERVRTYRWKDNIAVDHRLGESFNLQNLLGGDLDPVVEALIAEDRARRLAAL